MYERFPSWCYYRDGRSVIVASQQELDALEPGWATSPVGPWDDGFDGEPPWKPGKGPFAPDYTSQQYGSYPPSGSEWIYAAQPVCCNGWARNEGEVFRREGTLEEERLLLKGDVRPVPPGRRFKHEPIGRYEPTYRWFLDEPTRDAYALRYEAGDLTEWASSKPPDSIRSPTDRKTRGSQANYKSWTNTQALKTLKLAAQRVKDAGLPLTQENLGHYMSPRRHRNTMREILRWHGINIHNL
jgi:hypothetical protein